MYNVIDPRCGKPFFRYKPDHLPRIGDPIDWSEFVHLDGQPYDDTMIFWKIPCDSCGEPMTGLPGDFFSPFVHPDRWVKVEE